MKIIFLLMLIAMQIHAYNTKNLLYVIDGDTIVLSGKETCRLAYIDAPESKPSIKLDRELSQCKNGDKKGAIYYGRYAKNYLQSIMRKGHPYRYSVIDHDVYGRSVCIVYDDDGISFSEKMVTNGFASPFWHYIKDRNTFNRYRYFVNHAYSNQKGLWRVEANYMKCFYKKSFNK